MDLIIIVGMILTSAGAVCACAMSKLAATRIGFLASAAVVCVGLSNFGWLPFFGGTRSPAVYFGCGACCLGVLAACLFGAIEEVYRRFLPPPAVRRGSPVVPPSSKEL